MNKTQAGMIITVLLLVACIFIMPVVESEADAGTVTISSVSIDGDILTVTGTSSESTVKFYISPGYENDHKACDVIDGSYECLINISKLSAGSYSVVAFVNYASDSETFNIASVESVSLNKDATTIIVGDKETLTAVVSPDNATNKNIEWISTNETVAEVSNAGVVSAKSVGDTIIIVKTDDGNKTCRCSVSVVSGTVEVTGISLNKTSVAINANSNEKLIATLAPENATGAVTWSSDNPSYVSVDNVGALTPHAVGSATISATIDGHSAMCVVTVEYCVLTLSETAVTIEPNGTTTLTVTLPSGITGKLNWNSENSSKVVVNGSGTTVTVTGVSGVKEGIVNINVVLNHLYKATCVVTIKDPLSASCTTYHFFIQFVEGYDSTTYTGYTEAEMRAGFWIDGTGSTAQEALINTGLSVSFDETYYKGWLNIFLGLKTITNNDGTYTYWVQYHKSTEDDPWTYNQECLGYLSTMEYQYIALIYSTTSEMIGSTSVTGVSLNESSVTIAVGNSFTLTATVSPGNATDKTVSWSSNKSSVATVDSHGKVTGISAGTAVITVKTTDGDFVATCTVTVGNTAVSVTGVSLSSSSVTLMSDTEVLTATVSPGNAANKNVTWSSSDTSVVTVSNGVLTPVSAGTAVITVITEDGRFTATCSVTVKAVKVIDISVTPVTDADGNTSAKITDDQIASAVKNIKESADGDSKPIVTADISAGGSSGSSILTVSSSALKDLADVSADLKIVTDLGTVLLDSDTLASLSAKGDGDVAIAVADVDIGTLTDKQKEQVGDGLVVSFNVTVDNSAVHELGGTVSVTVPYELEDGQDASQVTVWYMDDEGNMDSVSCSYDSVNKTVRFTTDHFSYFVIEYGISVDDSGSVSGTDYMLIVAMIAIALILAGVGAYMFRRSKGAE